MDVNAVVNGDSSVEKKLANFGPLTKKFLGAHVALP